MHPTPTTTAAEASAGRAAPQTTGRQTAHATVAKEDAEAAEATGPGAEAAGGAEAEGEAEEARAGEDEDARKDTPMQQAYGTR